MKSLAGVAQYCRPLPFTRAPGATTPAMALLPDTVVAVEAYRDEGAGEAELYPEEAAFVVQAVAKRRREFAVVRSCARRAMEKLGVPPQPVLPGERGAPRWPDGLAGSMTHCDGYCAAALVRATDLASLGIDAEPHQPLPDGVLSAVSLPGEAEQLRRLAGGRPDVHWDRLLFSAKESVYKAWYPLAGRWLDFEEARVSLRPGGTFTARLLVPGPVAAFEGRWVIRDAHLATAIVHRPDGRAT